MSSNSIAQTNNPYTATIHYFSTKEGLSHNTVFDIFQDHRILYWLTTRYGLNRFDGNTFKWFTKEKHNLHSNVLDKVFEDKEGMLWLLSGIGQTRQLSGLIEFSIFNPYSETIVDNTQYLDTTLSILLKDAEFIFM